jgi:hypothetical protein
MVDVLMHAERHLRVGAIDGARRGEHEVLDAVVPAALENVQRADDVGIDVGVRVIDAVADAGLGGEVDDALRAHLGEQPLHAGSVGEVQFGKGEAGLTDELGEPVLFQFNVVVGIEIV